MKTSQTGLPRSAARSIVPPPTCGAVRAGAGRPTSGNGEAVWLAPGPAGVSVPLAATGEAPTAGDDAAIGAAEGLATAAGGAGVTRTAGAGVSAMTAAPRPTAAPMPTTSPTSTAMKLRIRQERSARAPRPPAARPAGPAIGTARAGRGDGTFHLPLRPGIPGSARHARQRGRFRW